MENFNKLLEECRKSAKEGAEITESDKKELLQEQVSAYARSVWSMLVDSGYDVDLDDLYTRIDGLSDEDFETLRHAIQAGDEDTILGILDLPVRGDSAQESTGQVDKNVPIVKYFSVHYTVEGKELLWSAPAMDEEIARTMTLERWPNAVIDKVVEGGLREQTNNEINVGDTIQVLDAEGNTTIVPKAVVAAKDEILCSDGKIHPTYEVTGSDDEDEQQWYNEYEYQVIFLRKPLESKVDEQEDEEEGPPPEPEEIKEPDDQPMEMRKEYLGKAEDTLYYFVTEEGAEGGVEDFLIVDQEGIKRYSGRDHNLEISEETVAEFIIQAIKDIDVEQIERSIFMKYVLPKIFEEEEPEDKIEEPEEEEKPKEKSKKEPMEIPPEEEEEEGPKESKKVSEKSVKDIETKDLQKIVQNGEELLKRGESLKDFSAGIKGGLEKIWNVVNKAKAELKSRGVEESIDIDQVNEMKVTDDEGNEFDVHLVDDGTLDTVIDINGREFRFDDQFASFWRDEAGELSEEGLRELASDALANMEPEDYQELVAKNLESEEDVSSESEDLVSPVESKDKDVGEKVKEGYDEPGERDGTGPHKDSAQHSISDVGVRKHAGERCPSELGDDELVAKIDELEVKYQSDPSPVLEDELNTLRRMAQERGLDIEESKNENKTDGRSVRMQGDKSITEKTRELEEQAKKAVDEGDYGKAAELTTKLAQIQRSFSSGSSGKEKAAGENKTDETVKGDDAEAIAKKSDTHHKKQDKPRSAKPVQGKQLGEPKDDADAVVKKSAAHHAKQDKTYNVKPGQMKSIRGGNESRFTEEAAKKSKKGGPLKKGAAVRNRGDCVFQSTHPKVTDDKDHFPINSENQARNALARANQYDSAPEWYKDSLSSLVKSVARAVHKKYPSIEVTKAAKTPGKNGKKKESKESKIAGDEKVEDISERKAEERLNQLLGT